jgi:hypothetical protein
MSLLVPVLAYFVWVVLVLWYVTRTLTYDQLMRYIGMDSV